MQEQEKVKTKVSEGASKPHRVVFLINFVPHYRISFYRYLAATPGVTFLLLHGRAEDASGRPGVANEALGGIPNRLVVNRKLRLGPYSVRWQSGALRAIRKHRPDTIVLSGISGTLSTWCVLIWAKLRGINTVMWTCGWEAQQKGTLAFAVKRILMRVFYKLPRSVLVYSTTAKAYMCELGVSAASCAICYNGLDIEEAQEKTRAVYEAAIRLRKQQGIESKTLFLYVGGMIPEKKVDLLLRAFARIRKDYDAALWLVGSGLHQDTLKSEAKQLQVPDVKFWGRIVDEVDSYFAASDYFVLPGLGGLALNQAMFRHTPCICSVADGTENDLVLNGQTGFRFVPNDEDSLVDAMQAAIAIRQNVGDYEKMSAHAYNLIRHRNNVKVMVKTFREALFSEKQ